MQGQRQGVVRIAAIGICIARTVTECVVDHTHAASTAQTLGRCEQAGEHSLTGIGAESAQGSTNDGDAVGAERVAGLTQGEGDGGNFARIERAAIAGHGHRGAHGVDAQTNGVGRCRIRVASTIVKGPSSHADLTCSDAGVTRREGGAVLCAAAGPVAQAATDQCDTAGTEVGAGFAQSKTNTSAAVRHQQCCLVDFDRHRGEQSVHNEVMTFAGRNVSRQISLRSSDVGDFLAHGPDVVRSQGIRPLTAAVGDDRPELGGSA